MAAGLKSVSLTSTPLRLVNVLNCFMLQPSLASSKCMMATGPLAVAQLGLEAFFSFKPHASCSTVSRSDPAACPLAECQTSLAHRVATATAAAAVGSPLMANVFRLDFPPQYGGSPATAILCSLRSSPLSRPVT